MGKADGDGDPSSGIISTAADLFKFSERLFSGKLITKKSLQEMLQNTKLSNCQDGECEYRLDIETWNQGRVKGYGKNGSSIGYEANWIYFPEKKITVITFANKGGGTNKGFIARLLK
jgi:D-alanyl-D-alanine carboxypeptidase